MNFLPDIIRDNIYVIIFFGPFVQEDAAVLAAASVSVNEMQPILPIFITILAGLILSDVWKYWIGWAALRNPRARAYAEKQHAVDLGDKVSKHLMVTLIAARFIPLSRIPAYVACGFFKVNYARFCLYVAFTAVLYIAAVFAVLHLLGEIMGEQLRWLIPVVGITVMIGFLLYMIWKRRKSQKETSRVRQPNN